MLIIVLWAIGTVACAFAVVEMFRCVNRWPFGNCSMLLSIVAGFSVLPLLNFVALAGAIWAINEDRKEN